MSSEATASIEIAPSELGTSLCTLRLCVPEAQRQMQVSLAQLGQLTPMQAWRMDRRLELFDGLKRHRAAIDLSWPTVRVEVHALDAVGAKVRLLRCNVTTGLSALEEAWVVRSLYRDNHLGQGQIAELLGRTDRTKKSSWVSRRLALAEDLSDELTAMVRLGLVSPTTCRELVRLPRGNQAAVAQVASRRGLTTRQTSRLVAALMATAKDQWPKLLEEFSLPAAPAGPKGGAPRRTPGEQLCADAWAMKRLATRLHVRLLERSLLSLGEPVCATVTRELFELRRTLSSLGTTLELRLGERGASDAAA